MPKRIYLNSFIVCGPGVRTKNSDEFNPNTAHLPKLWDTFFSVFPDAKIANYDIYGVYSDYESDHHGQYTVTAGLAMDKIKNKPNLPTITVEEGDYLIFESVGPSVEHIVATWQDIWSYFENNTHEKRSYTTDFEIYCGHEKAAIYIGIKPAEE